MKKRLIALLTGIATLSLSSVAVAGEGGVAGSAAFTVSGTEVTGVAVSAAIGKHDATAAAINTSIDNNYASAFGSAGVINANIRSALSAIQDGEAMIIQTSTHETNAQMAIPQANSFTSTSNVLIGTGTGAVVVDQQGIAPAPASTP